jgi:hypothetical protein
MSKHALDSELKNAAAEKIFSRRDALVRERATNREQQSILARRDREIERELTECRAAASFFGLVFDPLEDDPEIKELRERIQMYRARAEDYRTRGGSSEAFGWQRRADEFEEKLRVLIEQKTAQFGKDLFSSGKTGVLADENQPPAKQAKVKHIVLDRLRELSPEGARSSPLRQYLEQSQGIQVHEKTVGMTLYRLSNDGLVHRKGQTWFYGPQAKQSLPAEAENPGAGTPGQTLEAG